MSAQLLHELSEPLALDRRIGHLPLELGALGCHFLERSLGGLRAQPEGASEALRAVTAEE